MNHSRRAYNAPVWVMGILTFIMLVCAFTGVIGIMRTRHHDAAVRFSLFCAFLFLVFLAQAILYGVIRKRLFPRSLAWLHLACTIAVFVLPYIIEGLILPAISSTSYRSYDWVEGPVLIGVFIVGNVFFVLAIIKAFSTNSAPVIEDEASEKSI